MPNRHKAPIYTFTVCLLLIAISITQWACKKTEVPVLMPSISFGSGTGITDKNSIASPGTRLTITFIASRSDAPLSRIEATLNGVSLRLQSDSEARAYIINPGLIARRNTFRDTLRFNVPDSLGTYQLKISAFDTANRQASVSLSIQSKIPNYTLLQNIVMYGQATRATDTLKGFPTIGQYYATVYNKTYDTISLYPDLTAIDLSYGVTPTMGATLISPASRADSKVLQAPGGMQKTGFNTTLLDFSTVAGKDLILEKNFPLTAIGLTAGKTIVFSNQFGKRGIIKIDSVIKPDTLTKTRIRFQLKVLEF